MKINHMLISREHKPVDKLIDIDPLIQINRILTVREIADKLELSVGSVETVKYRLKFNKVNVR